MLFQFILLLTLCALPSLAQTYDSWVYDMLDAVNAHRRANGRPRVALDDRLMRAAAGHSADMASCQRMSHTGCDGSTMSERITASGYEWRGIAENVARGQRDVAAVMRSWINSPDHNRNLLGDFEHVGFGETSRYWTQKFGRPRVRRRESEEEGEDSYFQTVAEAAPGIDADEVDAFSEESTASRYSDDAFDADEVDAFSEESTASRYSDDASFPEDPVVERTASRYSSWVYDMLDAVNAHRRANGRPRVALDDRLMRAAAGHSADMASCQRMSHTGCDGSTMSERITASGYEWRGIAENVARGQRDVAAVMRSWINSPDHNRNLLGDFGHVGFGETSRYWTQKFGRPRVRRRESEEEGEDSYFQTVAEAAPGIDADETFDASPEPAIAPAPAAPAPPVSSEPSFNLETFAFFVFFAVTTGFIFVYVWRKRKQNSLIASYVAVPTAMSPEHVQAPLSDNQTYAPPAVVVV